MSRHLPKHDSKSGGLEKGSARLDKTAETGDSQISVSKQNDFKSIKDSF